MLRSLLYFATATCFLVSARAQWQTNQPFQRSHQLSQLSDASQLKVCQMTDIAVIKSILKPLLVERIVDTPGHRKVGEYLKNKADEYGLTTEWDDFKAQTPHGVKQFRNLIATYDALAPRRIVLACHYDSKILRGQVFIAATDSAVPCAIILDIARTLGPIIHQRSNKHISLQLIFLDGEEAFVDWNERDSLYGARHLSDHWAKKWFPSTDGSSFDLNKEIDRIDVFMLLDLIGASNPRFTSTVGHGTTNLFQDLPKIETKLKELGCMKHIPKMFYPGTSWAAVEDDHIPFMRKGVPIMHLISVPFPSVWHTARDNESILDYNTIENVASVVRLFVAKYLGIAP
ncbi:hypothetical protein QR680_007001 [Steinernema hermaphroditum]|uniref:Glutaminyl-peptide cyclotransferase n=1 Tax=Steinernema hermaphroditum TaxID=289476 RepID=A0AA39HZH4_9BILA|nr:hypothetical protein QR680_007001 [Steinernema hermaphroditum]